MQIGRHENCSCAVTNHLPINFQRTRIFLDESHLVVYFQAAATNKVRYVLQTYVVLDPEQMKYLRKCGARWVAIYRHFPQLCLTETECVLPHQKADDET